MMKVTITVIFDESGHLRPLTILASKSSGEHLPLIVFSGKDSLEAKENVDLGDVNSEEVLLFSVLDFPTSHYILPIKEAHDKNLHVFHINDPKVTISIQVYPSTPFSEVLDEKFEKAVEFLENLTLPWFLRSSSLYAAAKQQVSHLSIDSSTQKYLDVLAAHVQNATVKLLCATRPLLTEEEASSLVYQIDDILEKLFLNIDDSVQVGAARLATLLRSLKKAVLIHLDRFVRVVYKHTADADIYFQKHHPDARASTLETLAVARSQVATLTDAAYKQYPIIQKGVKDTADLLIHYKSELLHRIEQTLSQVREFITATLNTARNHLQSTIETRITSSRAAGQHLLHTAQPYVHHAIVRAQPLVAQAVAYSVEVCQAKPVAAVLVPLTSRAEAARDAIVHSSVAGPYLEVVVKEGLKAYETVKAYCLEETASPAVNAATN